MRFCNGALGFHAARGTYVANIHKTLDNRRAFLSFHRLVTTGTPHDRRVSEPKPSPSATPPCSAPKGTPSGLLLRSTARQHKEEVDGGLGQPGVRYRGRDHALIVKRGEGRDSLRGPTANEHDYYSAWACEGWHPPCDQSRGPGLPRRMPRWIRS